MDRLISIIESSKEKYGDSFKFAVPNLLSKKVISLHAIREDLLFVRNATHELITLRLVKQDKKNITDPQNTYETLQRALWYSSIAIYGKCFTDASKAGKTKLEPIHCFAENNSMLEIHNKIMRLRHEHIAHRGDTEFDQSIAILLIPKTGETDSSVNEYRIMNQQLFTSNGEELIKFLEVLDHLIKSHILSAGH